MDRFNRRSGWLRFCFKFSCLFSVFWYRFRNRFRIFVIAVLISIFFVSFNICSFIFIISFKVFRSFVNWLCNFFCNLTFLCLNWSNWFKCICRFFNYFCSFWRICYSFLFYHSFCNDVI